MDTQQQPTPQQHEMVVIIRPSFKRILGPDPCRSGLYNHILFRLARKAKGSTDEQIARGEVVWYASAQDITEDLDHTWSLNKVRKEAKDLANAGLLIQRHNEKQKWDRKFQYVISPDQGRMLAAKAREAGVCLEHIGLPADVLHFLHLVDGAKEGVCICQKGGLAVSNQVDASMPDESTSQQEYVHVPPTQDASAIDGTAITKGSGGGVVTKGSNQEERLTLSAHAPADLSTFDFDQVWSAQAILSLAATLLPLQSVYKSPQLAQEATQKQEKAADTFALSQTHRDRGLRKLAWLMAASHHHLQVTESKKQPRLWGLLEPGVERMLISKYEAEGWWPDLPGLEAPVQEWQRVAAAQADERAARKQSHQESQESDHGTLAYQHLNMDLLLRVPRSERIGIPEAEAMTFLLTPDEQSGLTPEAYFDAMGMSLVASRMGTSGVRLTLSWDGGEVLITSWSQWDVLIEADQIDPIGTPGFGEALRELCDEIRQEQARQEVAV